MVDTNKILSIPNHCQDAWKITYKKRMNKNGTKNYYFELILNYNV